MKENVKFGLITVMLGSVLLAACSNVIYENEHDAKFSHTQEVVIGDEVIYGEAFSLENVYECILKEIEETSRTIAARNANANKDALRIDESDMVKMKYFSVSPKSIDSLKLVNEKMGYLNPAELDKDIIQACDPDKLIFIDTDVSESTKIDDCVNFETKYYYITTMDFANEMSAILEGFETIEDFDAITTEALERVQNEYQDYIDVYGDDLGEQKDRGIFGRLWGMITSAVKSVVDFVVKPYNINGSVYYKYNNIELPAYGVNVKNICIGGGANITNINGYFDLGKRTGSAGLCSIWLSYENEACKLTNFLGVTASTLIKTSFPSKLQNMTIKTDSSYANAKMAICSDILKRYKDESIRHNGIPKALIWTTQLGSGTSSAPAFNLRGLHLLPDLVLTDVSSKADKNALYRLETLHHEYTHFLHVSYNSNRNQFWNNVVLSEIGSAISNATIDTINALFHSQLEKKYKFFYDFTNPYVCFAENYAEWYSYVGCYSKGLIGKKFDENKGTGKYVQDDKLFTNQKIFANLVQTVCPNADDIVGIIDKYDVITFNELYAALVKEYPAKKTQINEFFKNSYRVYGNRDGNVINYQ